MDRVRTIWVGYDGYLRALRELVRAFERGLPSSDAIGALFRAEQAVRDQVSDLDLIGLEAMAMETGVAPDWLQEQAVALVRAERGHDAQALLGLCDVLFPNERGISQAVVAVQTGHYDAGCAQLVRIAQDAENDRPRRLAALEALNDVGALDLFLETTFKMASGYAASHDFESVWMTVNTAECVLHGVFEESQQRWHVREGDPPVRH